LALTAGLIWIPNPGPQAQAYFSPADELFYCGQAGGGKTDLGLGAHRAPARVDPASHQGRRDSRINSDFARSTYTSVPATLPEELRRW
jgi:hypothetical protein